jgi:hypothetical protein
MTQLLSGSGGEDMTVDICTEVLSMLNRLMGRISELETRLNHLEVEHLARRMDITTVETPIVEKPAMESVPVQVERMSWPEIISQLVREAGSGRLLGERIGWTERKISRHIYDVDVPSQQDFNCVITHIPEKIDAANAALNNALNETLRK